jgi:hypothetical protein
LTSPVDFFKKTVPAMIRTGIAHSGTGLEAGMLPVVKELATRAIPETGGIDGATDTALFLLHAGNLPPFSREV